MLDAMACAPPVVKSESWSALNGRVFSFRRSQHHQRVLAEPENSDLRLVRVQSAAYVVPQANSADRFGSSFLRALQNDVVLILSNVGHVHKLVKALVAHLRGDATHCSSADGPAVLIKFTAEFRKAGAIFSERRTSLDGETTAASLNGFSGHHWSLLLVNSLPNYANGRSSASSFGSEVATTVYFAAC